jgi:hypothetical protein
VAPLEDISSLVILNGTTSIGEYALAFLNRVPNLGLKKIYIPKTVKTIGAFAFTDCGNITLHYCGT